MTKCKIAFANAPKEGPLCSFGTHISYEGVIISKRLSRALSEHDLFSLYFESPPTGTEIGVLLGRPTDLGGVGIMAIGKQIAN